jgi:hypothetical protein
MKIPYTTDEVIKAINHYTRYATSIGLCRAFNVSASDKNTYQLTPKFLTALGGRSNFEWFWIPPYFYYRDSTGKEGRKAINERKTMLAFMWVWSQDKDFEV